MKKLTFLIAIAALLGAGTAYAQQFDLSELDAGDVRAAQYDFRAPAPLADVSEKAAQTGSDLLGLDVNVRVPYKLMKNAVTAMAATESRLTIIDRNAAVVFKYGEFLRISNIRIDQGGIIVVPTLTLKPYFVATDKFAVRVQRIQLHASMEPSVKAAPPQIDQEQIMVQVMDVLIKGVYSALDAKLKAKNIPLRAQDVVALRYDKAAWTLHAQLSSRIMGHFIPAGLIGDLHLTGFSFSDSGLAIKLQTAN
jgi:hypothetical protein